MSGFGLSVIWDLIRGEKFKESVIQELLASLFLPFVPGFLQGPIKQVGAQYISGLIKGENMDPLVAKIVNLIYSLVFYPLGLLNLLWIAPTLALWRRVWHVLKPAKNIRGRTVVITGASSGIGEHIAFEFAKRNAKLVLAARRLERLQTVAETCYRLGSPDVEIVQADVQKEADCKAIIDHAIQKFDRIDILVNNAGITHSFLISDAPNFDMDAAQEVVNTTFWGQVYPTYYAMPHLKATGGQLLNVISVASYIPFPRMAFYNAAKHAALGFYDTVRAEVGSRVSITNILPGWIESEMTEGKILDAHHKAAWDVGLRDEHVGPWPIMPVDDLARVAVESALKRERNVVFPFWYIVFLYYRIFAAEVLEWTLSLLYLSGRPAPSKKIVQMVGEGAFNMPEPGTQKMETEALYAQTGAREGSQTKPPSADKKDT